MRGFVVAGNWKMNTDVDSAGALVDEMVEGLAAQPLRAGVTVVLCPPFPSLSTVSERLNGTPLHLGAQNLHYENDGAYTGEVSASMLRAVGCGYVIVGHSERRQYFHEDDATVNRKARKALASSLIPIICVGETLAEREADITESIVRTQVHEAFAGITREQASVAVVAYEPVWAIGTGRTATPAQAQEVHAFIRGQLAEIYDAQLASEIIIQYGGSMKAENALELLSQPDVDGGLIGGASIISGQFLAIIAAANAVLEGRT
jgi:triosephosphate isomerase